MKKDKNLEKIKNVILETSHPDKIILFGSRARKNPGTDSDYDILVLKNNLENERNESRNIYKALYQAKIEVPVDVITIDSKKWEAEKNNKYLIYSNICSEGIVLYG